MSRRSRWLVATALALTLAGCSSDSLQSLQDAGSEIVVGFVYDESNPKSAAFNVCTGGDPVEIVAVDPIETIGQVEYLGAFLLAEGDAPIGSANGFPPEGYENVLQPMGDAQLSFDCALAPERVAQIVVGADWSGPGGGQLSGFRVEYTANGSAGTLDVPGFVVEMCGADGEYCDN